MRFNSFEFLVFAPVVIAIYWFLPHRAQNRFLLAASILFYGSWDWRFVILLGISTVVDYTVTHRLAVTDDERRRRLLLLGSLVVNLGLLAVFKYYGFFVDSATDLLDRIGFSVHPTVLSVALPLGISFYTFQTLSYTIDVYRRRAEPAKTLEDFALFVSFFPHMIAGPIQRAGQLLPQIERPRQRLDAGSVQSGLGLIVLGLVRKVVIADTAAPVANRIFGQPEISDWKTLLVGALAFAIQIYGDFAGYTNIARGVARLLGFEFSHNFLQPYFSRNITEFWHRWHITLSNWLRDYLYVPLGGNRGGRRRTYLNLMIVMLLGGLWHGAAWTFVVWGGLHGAMLAGHRFLSKGRDRFDDPPRLRQLPAILLTFAAVTATWVFFRAASIGDAVDYLSGIATMQAGFFDVVDLVLIVGLGLAMVAVDAAERWVHRSPAPALLRPEPLGALAGVGLATIVIASGSDVVPFIYFQF